MSTYTATIQAVFADGSTQPVQRVRAEKSVASALRRAERLYTEPCRVEMRAQRGMPAFVRAEVVVDEVAQTNHRWNAVHAAR